MKTILYIIIFIMGTVFGSFSTLAIYRIPKKKNITHERSFCPNCKHKLGFFDLIPVFSYIFLGGKCKYCGKKISKSYFLIETLIGLASLGIFITLDLSSEILTTNTLTEYLCKMIFVTTLIIIAGIDRNDKKINKSIMIAGASVGLIHMIYSYIVKDLPVINIYKYVIYFVMICILSIYINRNKMFKYKYLLEILTICIYINMFIKPEEFLITAILTMISLTGSVISKKRKMKTDKNGNLDIPIAFFLCISNIIAMIIQAIPMIIQLFQ